MYKQLDEHKDVFEDIFEYFWEKENVQGTYDDQELDWIQLSIKHIGDLHGRDRQHVKEHLIKEL
jgi:hypothetical protein